MLSERLFTRIPACVLTSATLTVGDSFEYVRARIGFSEGRELSLASEFNVRKQALLYIPKAMPDYRHPSYLHHAAEEIREILRASQGRASCSSTSYRQMETMYDFLSNDLPYPCMRQGKGGGKSRLLEEFKITPNGVLFATASFWQGVDVKGEALSAVVIDKLPFQVPTDPLVAARSAQIQREGGNSFSQYHVPNAILRLKQGWGDCSARPRIEAFLPCSITGSARSHMGSCLWRASPITKLRIVSRNSLSSWGRRRPRRNLKFPLCCSPSQNV